MPQRPALVTGFEPYGGRGTNPAGEVARALDGGRASGVPVVARTLPVSFMRLRSRIAELLRELDPIVVISLGLWPGEPMIRIERLGVNVADFEIADNEGTLLVDRPVGDNGPAAFAATLPIRQIEGALLDVGIPARLSSTAGTFLCNACLYSFLEESATAPRATLCGFIHLPYVPSQVAALLKATRRDARLELHQRADLASMDLPTAVKAVQIALEVSVGEALNRPRAS